MHAGHHEHHHQRAGQAFSAATSSVFAWTPTAIRPTTQNRQSDRLQAPRLPSHDVLFQCAGYFHSAPRQRPRVRGQRHLGGAEGPYPLRVGADAGDRPRGRTSWASPTSRPAHRGARGRRRARLVLRPAPGRVADLTDGVQRVDVTVRGGYRPDLVQVRQGYLLSWSSTAGSGATAPPRRLQRPRGLVAGRAWPAGRIVSSGDAVEDPVQCSEDIVMGVDAAAPVQRPSPWR